jgi:hypothetical protein
MIVMDHHGEQLVYDIRQAMGRPYKDIDYITNSWLQAYKIGPAMDMPGLTDRDYYYYTHKKLDEIIPRCSEAGSLYMCHTKDDLFNYKGYLVAEAFENFPPIIHWCQVKKEHKRHGVATALLKQFMKDFDITPGAFIYTFSSSDMKKKPAIRIALEELGLKPLYIPDLKRIQDRPVWDLTTPG